jgi:hypothetical protein
MTDGLIAAHKHSFQNRDEVMSSVQCGCFYCGAIVPPAEVVDWVNDKGGQTAICPKCRIDSVLGDASGYPITREFLRRMKQHWFESRESAVKTGRDQILVWFLGIIPIFAALALAIVAACRR